jgi:hypothetical protein
MKPTCFAQSNEVQIRVLLTVSQSFSVSTGIKQIKNSPSIQNPAGQLRRSFDKCLDYPAKLNGTKANEKSDIVIIQ